LPGVWQALCSRQYDLQRRGGSHDGF
jgi:hypothetical protein